MTAFSEEVNLIDGNNNPVIAIVDGVNQPLAQKALLDDKKTPA